MAFEPINYMAAMPQQDLLRNIQGGLALGSQIRQINEAEAAQQRAQAAAKLYNDDVNAAISNPTPQAFSSLALKYPKQREAIKQAWDGLDEGERKSQSEAMSQSYAALLAGKPDIAKQVVQTRIDARKNSGMDYSTEENVLKLLDSDPRQAQASLGFILSHTTDPKKFAETFGKLGTEQRAQELAPEELKQKQAEATIKAEEAKTARQKFALELEGKGWDIKKVQEDIRSSKEGTRLRAMEVALSRENNQLKRKELEQKISEASEKQLEKVREKAADLESARGQMDNMLNTADRILATPKDVVGSAAGPISSRMFTASQDTADFEELVNTLGSQSFLAQIPNIKGMGALSNAEGEKLQAALQSLSLRQSPERLLTNVREAQRLILKSRQNIAKRYGAPDTGPDRPDAAPAASDFGGGTAAPAPANQRSVVVDY